MGDVGTREVQGLVASAKQRGPEGPGPACETPLRHTGKMQGTQVFTEGTGTPRPLGSLPPPPPAPRCGETRGCGRGGTGGSGGDPSRRTGTGQDAGHSCGHRAHSGAAPAADSAAHSRSDAGSPDPAGSHSPPLPASEHSPFPASGTSWRLPAALGPTAGHKARTRTRKFLSPEAGTKHGGAPRRPF
jgi:hypothetical protein